MYDNNQQATSKGPPRIGKLAILSIVMLTAIGMAGLATAAAQSSGGDKQVEASATLQINAKALTGHGCNDSEWHFVITQIDAEANAPKSINVTWANGTHVEVPLQTFSDQVAHYSTTLALNSTVANATAEIYADWDGQFNLIHGPCVALQVCLDFSVTAAAGPANQLHWTPFVHAEAYNVYRATDGENFSLVATVDAGLPMFEDRDVEQGQTYQYMVNPLVDGQEIESCAEVEVTAIPVFSTTFAAAAAGILGIGGYALVQRRA